jgi:hypothetical protein
MVEAKIQDQTQHDQDTGELALATQDQSEVNSRYNISNQLTKFEAALDSSFDKEDLKTSLKRQGLTTNTTNMLPL